MRKSGKWIHLLVLMSFFVSTMPFSSHAMMSHSATVKAGMADPADYTIHHHQTDKPQEQHNATDPQQCECLTAGCYNTALPDISYSVLTEYMTGTDFPVVDTHTHSAHVNRLERPPCT